MNANCTVDDLDITKANPRGAKVALTGQRRRTYPTREAERQDALKYIELFYNSKRKHTHNNMLSPIDFKARQQKLELGWLKNWGLLKRPNNREKATASQ